jgi:acetyl-CoA carboxylase biotin carboxyl carrier protein
MNLTNEDVQEILRLLDASSFDELHLSTARFKLTLRRSAGSGWTQQMQTTAAPAVARSAQAGAHGSPAKAAGPAAAPCPAPAPAGPARASADGIIDVQSPLIGTFYRAPKPGALPFVELGSKVGRDTVVGIVETMKLMNSVYAGAAGEVAEICAVNGQLVEQGQVLMRLRARS